MPEESDNTQQQKTRRSLRALADEGRELGEWKPQQAKLRDKQAQLLKQFAAAVLDWDMLDRAVEQEISDQRNLVEWWAKNVQRQGPKIIADPRLFTVPELEDISGIGDHKVSRWRTALNGDPEEYSKLLRGPSWRKAMGERGSTDQKGASGTGENEWFTPPEYIEIARQVLGEIDLDPATHASAQQFIQAREFYTEDDNGLVQDWHGRVWLNPPYAQPFIKQFIDKLCAERRTGRVTGAILLTHNYTDTRWFRQITKLADAICFAKTRVRFIQPGGKPASPTQGQAFSYFGDDVPSFESAFCKVGFIVTVSRQFEGDEVDDADDAEL
jgi:ParB family chromosome partitioning protein